MLDADLKLTPAGDGQALLRLDGAYRPPMAGVGAALDRMVMHRAAKATIRSLLSQIAGALTSPAPAAGPAAQPGARKQAWFTTAPETPA